jgi:lipooligosaccharide transport system permease protein
MTAIAEVAPSPRMAYRVWRRNVRVFGKLWKGSLAPQFIDPVFYLLAMGFGLGKYLQEVNGIPYKEFVGTGLIASAVMWAASFETTWNIYFRMQETRLYDSILTTPVEVPDIVAAELWWAATRSLIYGTVFLGVVTLFGLVSSPWAVLIPLAVILGGLAFGVMGLTFTAVVGKVDYYSYYYTLFITPMFLFSGLFYPLDRLPDWVTVAAWFTPLYHLVNLTRGLALGPEFWSIVGNATWLIVLVLVLFPIPVRAMRRRLVA